MLFLSELAKGCSCGSFTLLALIEIIGMVCAATCSGHTRLIALC